jgi:hypothetical protein
MYEIDSPWAGLMTKVFTDVQSYQVIAVDARTLKLESYSADGRPIDTLELKKP